MAVDRQTSSTGRSPGTLYVNEACFVTDAAALGLASPSALHVETRSDLAAPTTSSIAPAASAWCAAIADQDSLTVQVISAQTLPFWDLDIVALRECVGRLSDSLIAQLYREAHLRRRLSVCGPVCGWLARLSLSAFVA